MSNGDFALAKATEHFKAQLQDKEESIEGFNTITFQVKDGVFDTWNKWCRQVENSTGVKSKALAFEQAIAKAIME